MSMAHVLSAQRAAFFFRWTNISIQFKFNQNQWWKVEISIDEGERESSFGSHVLGKEESYFWVWGKGMFDCGIIFEKRWNKMRLMIEKKRKEVGFTG